MIHELVVRKYGSGKPTLGKGGRKAAGSFKVRGQIAMLTTQEAAAIGQFHSDVVAVARVPLDTDIAQPDEVEAPEDLGALLGGVWQVATVQHTALHLRAFLRRTTIA